MKWKETDKGLEKVIVFDNQSKLAAFVLLLANHSDEVEHHADMIIRYNQLTLRVMTHDAMKITEKDFALASFIDRAYQETQRDD